MSYPDATPAALPLTTSRVDAPLRRLLPLYAFISRRAPSPTPRAFSDALLPHLRCQVLLSLSPASSSSTRLALVRRLPLESLLSHLLVLVLPGWTAFLNFSAAFFHLQVVFLHHQDACHALAHDLLPLSCDRIPVISYFGGPR